MKKAIRYLLAALIVAVIIGGTLLRSMGYFIHDIYWFQEALGGDRVTHIIMGGGLVVACWLLFPKMPLSKLIIIVAVFLLLEELAQKFHPYREFSLVDLLFGLLGVFLSIGCLAGFKYFQAFSSKKSVKG